MIKKTLYFGNPAYLSVKFKQLVITLKDDVEPPRTIPVEDIGIVLLDHPQITVTYEVMRLLMDYDGVIITCDERHMPHGYMLPLSGHHTMQRTLQHQISCSQPLAKQLWQQTVIAKIANQSAMLSAISQPTQRLDNHLRNVQSGDSTNQEGQAAAYYWPKLFGADFIRDQDGEPPNHLLNYGYAILRAIVARSLVSSGLHPGIGIHHHNQYNPYCLADDIMEPFRPYVDDIVYNIWQQDNLASFLTKEMKAQLLSIATVDIKIGNAKSPLMVGISQTTASLAACLAGKARKIKYPTM